MDAEGRVRVLDFGLARPTDAPDPVPVPAAPEEPSESLSTGSSRLTEAITTTGTVMGTPSYMAPEQHAAARTDERSDQFSFCVALYEALYDDRPFPGKTAEALQDSILAGRIREPPRGITVPAWVRAVVLRGLQAEPERRYPSMRALLSDLSRDPARRWRRGALGVVVVAAVVAGAIGLQEVRERRALLCSGAQDKLVGIWDEGRRKTIHGAFLQTSRPYAPGAWEGVRTLIDDHAARWVDMHTEACRATRIRGEQSDKLLDLRMQCLSRLRQELRALTDVFAEADGKVVQRAVQAAHRLRPIDACADTESLLARVPPPDNTAERDLVEGLRGRLADARALRMAGKQQEALERAEQLARDAAEVGYAPLEAEALLLLGRLETDAGKANDAVETLRRAALEADIGQDDPLRLEIQGRLVYALGYKLKRFDEAGEAVQRGKALIERTGAQGVALADLLAPIGSLHQAEGDMTAAEDAYREALELRQRHLPATHPDIAAALNNLANAVMFSGRPEEARELLERAVDLWTEALGPEHPLVAQALTNVGIVLGDTGKHRDAIATHHRARKILEAALGDEHPTLGYVHNNLGVEHDRLGEHEEALSQFESAAELMRSADEMRAAQATANTGNVLRELGRAEESLQRFDSALTVLRATLSDDHPQLVNPLSGKGLSLLSLGRVDEAIPLLERALVLRLAGPPREIELAEVRFALARALWERKRARPRALELARLAREGYSRVPQAPALRETERIDAWLAERTAVPASR
jgi:tetratricopeptide (TPR) repeat protein